MAKIDQNCIDVVPKYGQKWIENGRKIGPKVVGGGGELEVIIKDLGLQGGSAVEEWLRELNVKNPKKLSKLKKLRQMMYKENVYVIDQWLRGREIWKINWP